MIHDEGPTILSVFVTFIVILLCDESDCIIAIVRFVHGGILAKTLKAVNRKFAMLYNNSTWSNSETRSDSNPTNGRTRLTIKRRTIMKSTPVVQEIPDRVAFVNIRSGNVFFDCHPSEARAAMRVVADIRENGSLEKRQKEKEAEKFRLDVAYALSLQIKPIEVELFCNDSELTVEFLSNQMSRVEKQDCAVDFVIVNSSLYPWFRTQEYLFDPHTDVETLRMGKLGHFWAVDVVVNEGCPPNDILFCSFNNTNRNPVITRCRLSYHPVPISVQDQLDKLEKLSADVREAVKQIRLSFGPKSGIEKT